jgi:hypothetical protein
MNNMIEQIQEALAENKTVVGVLKDGRLVPIQKVVYQGTVNLNEEIVSIQIK